MVQETRRLLPKGTRPRSRGRWAEVPAWTFLVGFLVLVLPLFLCLSLWVDTDYYGIWAWEILHGRVLEKELNAFQKPPAMAWVLTIPLALVGWRPVAVRLLDFTFVTAIVWMLTRWLRPMGLSRAARVWTALALYAFYLSTAEWCHAQPDVWMMLPALGALYMRRLQTADALAGRGSLREALALGMAEGFLWGLACLFKPFVVVPGFLAWLLSTLLVYLRRPGVVRRLTLATVGVLVGGCFAGGIWMAWLLIGGGWSYYWEDFRAWGGGYYRLSPPLTRRLIYLFTQFPPWGLANAAALVIAAGALWRVVRGARRPKRRLASTNRLIQETLLAAFYLGWLVVGNYIQFQFDYHIVPPMLLAITLVAARCPVIFRALRLGGYRWVFARLPCGRLALRAPAAWGLLLLLVAVLALRHPLLKRDRLRLWAQCVRTGGTPEIQDDLALRCDQSLPVRIQSREFDLGGYWMPSHVQSEDLARVANFLRSQHVGDGELVCFATHTTALLLELDVAPSSRLLLPYNLLSLYPDKLDQLAEALNAHIERQRFAVTDVSAVYNGDMAKYLAQPNLLALPEDFPPDMAATFPWYEPVVFRSGPYLVHRIRGPIRALHKL